MLSSFVLVTGLWGRATRVLVCVSVCAFGHLTKAFKSLDASSARAGPSGWPRWRSNGSIAEACTPDGLAATRKPTPTGLSALGRCAAFPCPGEEEATEEDSVGLGLAAVLLASAAVA